MKTTRLTMIVFTVICCVSWVGNILAAQYDPSVERAQWRLAELGYDAGATDGILGGKTVTAIKTFQDVNKLTVTGALDESTMKALKIDGPTIKCARSGCTVENGVTEEMVHQIRQHFAEEKSANEVVLKGATDTDLQQLSVLNEVFVRLKIVKSEYLSDIAPLEALTTLEDLELDGLTKLTDLTPLGKLTGLQDLRLNNLGQPVDITALEKLEKLEKLTLSSLNKDSEEPFDISMLAGKPHLENLGFYLVKVSDLSPIQDSTELTRLYLETTRVADLTPLKALTKLGELMLLNIPATDLSPVGALTELAQLGLRDLKVTDLAFLSSLGQLRVLTLNNIPANDMSSVGALTELRNLALFKTQFADYAPVEKCTKLETFTARYDGEGFNKLEVITAMPNLKTLYLDGNGSIHDWQALSTAKSLESLWVSKTSFSDLSLLQGLEKLHTLGLNECAVTHPEAIAALPALTTIHIKKTQGIDDLMVFKSLPKLAELKVYYENKQFSQEQGDALKEAIKTAKN